MVKVCVLDLVSVTQGDKMDVGSASSDEEDMDEFRYDMDIDENRFLFLCFVLHLCSWTCLCHH